MTPLEAIQANMDKFELVAEQLGWVATRLRGMEGWNQFVIFEGKNGRRYSVNFHPAHYTVAGLTTIEFEKHGCYLSSQESGKLSDTTSRMSASKSVEALVKEISRRVVAPYETFFGIMGDKVQQAKEYAKEAVEKALKIGGILDANIRGYEYDGQEFLLSKSEELRAVKSFPEGVTLNIRFYAESVRWEYVSLPHDLHEKLCRVVADHFKKR